MTRTERLTGWGAARTPLNAQPVAQSGRPVVPARRGHLADLAAAWASSVREPLSDAEQAATLAAQFAADDAAPVAPATDGDFLRPAGRAGRTRS